MIKQTCRISETRFFKMLPAALLAVVLFCFLLPKTVAVAEGGGYPLACVLCEDAPEGEVRVQFAEDRSWLLLPASADFKHLMLRGPANTVLRGTRPDRSICLDENGAGEDLDLTQLFGPMQPGNQYLMTVSTGSGRGIKTTKITLMKSAALNSLHISLDKPISEINASQYQSVSGSGYLLKLDADGNRIAEAEVERLAGRGNASWTHSGAKRPYQFRLSEAAQLIAGAGTAKSWCLLSNNVMSIGHDRTGLYNTVAMKLFQDMNGSSALSAENVDLYINGEYRGTYLLTEKPEIQENRVNIRKSAYAKNDAAHFTRVIRRDISASGEMSRLLEIMSEGTRISLRKEDATTGDELLLAGIQAYQFADGSELKPGGEGGFLLELDFRFYLSDCWFLTRHGAQVVVKEPENVSYEQLREIALFVQQMEDGLYAESGFNHLGRHYSDYIDLSSLAVRYAVDAFMANTDAFLTSAYFYADRDESGGLTRLCAGPAWDFDYADLTQQSLLNKRIGQTDGYPEMWMLQFLTKGDFMNEFQNVCRTVLRPLWLKLNEGGMEALIAQLSVSQKMNQVLWGNAFDISAPVFAEQLRERYALWYDTLWQDDLLTGVRIVPEKEGLAARITGSADEVRWYRVGEDSAWELNEIAVTGPGPFMPDMAGYYLALASGGNIAYNPALKDNPDYKKKGIPSLVVRETITLSSEPVWFEPGNPER